MNHPTVLRVLPDQPTASSGTLRIQHLDGTRAGEVQEFSAAHGTVQIGTDPSNHVVLPAGHVDVQARHCTLEPEQGRWRLHLLDRAAVFGGEQPMVDGLALPRISELRLGSDGPRLQVETFGPDSELFASVVASPRGGPAPRRPRFQWLAVPLAALAMLSTAVGGYHPAHSSTPRVTVPLATPTATELLQAVAETARASVYAVLVLDNRGELRRIAGTAFVVDRDRGLLGTNAHVANVRDALRPGETLALRGSGRDAATLRIRSARVHPGFALWKRHRAEAASMAQSPIAVGDVALLEVEPADADQLGAPMRLASSREVQELRLPEPALYIGFPTEQIAGGGFDPEHPAPIVQPGYINKLTDFHFAAASRSASHLLHFSMGLSGGASGSPILDPSGRVVGIVSAASFYFADGRRFVSAAGENFGQRIDLLHELLAETPRPGPWLSAWVAENARRCGAKLDRVAAELLARLHLPIESPCVVDRALALGERVHHLVLPRDGRFVVLLVPQGEAVLTVEAFHNDEPAAQLRPFRTRGVILLEGKRGDRFDLLLQRHRGTAARCALRLYRVD
ncbi:MAG: trypsin-like peptidase domain-containing protein [Planctomycetes bacterium]|nr:trypsin-like peptidase domain-containing protein [Planctomycetota bacterium]